MCTGLVSCTKGIDILDFLFASLEVEDRQKVGLLLKEQILILSLNICPRCSREEKQKSAQFISLNVYQLY